MLRLHVNWRSPARACVLAHRCLTGTTCANRHGLAGAQLLEYYPHVLTLRVRMPISDDLGPRNFVTKISKCVARRSADGLTNQCTDGLTDTDWLVGWRLVDCLRAGTRAW